MALILAKGVRLPPNSSPSGSAVPVGAFIWHTGSTAPSGWLIADGAARLRSEYPALWAFAQGEISIGNEMYGAGDGSTTFTIRTMENEFIRGKTGGRAIGSAQAGMSQINDGVVVRVAAVGSSDGYYDQSGLSTTSGLNDLSFAPWGNSASMYPETRPQNIALLPIVKY